jgi:hypothetical protein
VNVLIVGSGKGSFEMRGVQVGAALGARVVAEPTDADLQWSDVVVLVKRAGRRWAMKTHLAGKPVVWDVLDGWHQPAQNSMTEADAVAWLRREQQMVKPAVTICATQAMADACGGVYVPHHGWQGLRPTPARPEIQAVAYQGNSAYLGRYAKAIQDACRDRHWTFLINPADLSQADVLVAFRDGPWDGWVCRQWKSGVKLVNAICAGRPILTQHSAAWEELQPDGALAEAPETVGVLLDVFRPVERRQAVVNAALTRAGQFSLETIAGQYRQVLSTVRMPVSV